MKGALTPTTDKMEVDSATFMSFNPTGIDNPVKCSWINDICVEYSVDFLSIQEHFKSSKTTDKYFRDKFPNYHSVVVPGHREPGQDTGRARAGLGQLSKKNIAVKRTRISSKHYRVQAQLLHLPATSILWLNTYFPTDPQLVGDYDDSELQACLSEVELILESSTYGGVIWGSDINWDMSRNTKFVRTVSGFLQRMNLVPLWNHHQEISHTFEQVFKNGRVSRSTVDHFLLSPGLLPLVVDCGVIHRGENLSVHAPIWVRLKLGALPIRNKIQLALTKKPSWSKACSKFVRTVSGFLQRMNLVPLWNHHQEISHTFEQVFKNGRVSRSTVDHFLLSPGLLPLVVDCGVIHRGENLSVHAPIWVRLKLGALPIRNKIQLALTKKPSWSKACSDQVQNFTATLHENLQKLKFSPSMQCLDVKCKEQSHLKETDSVVLDILCCMVEASYTTLPLYGGKGGGRGKSKFPTAFPGWTEEVGPYQAEARYWHDTWVREGTPRGYWLHGLMVKKRAQYHYAIRRLRKKSDLTRAKQLFEASLQGDINLLAEMKKIRCGGAGGQPDLPEYVAGAQGEDEIAEKFKTVYETLYSSAASEDEMTVLLERVNRMVNQNSVEEVAKVSGTKVKEAACLLKPKKSDISGGFTSDALLNAPDILFDQLATVFRS